MRKEQKETSVMHRVWTIVGIVLCVILIPILIINCTLIVKSFTKSNDVPSIGGTFPLIVLTDSMYPEIQSGDLIICHTTDAQDVKTGDVIAFFDPQGNGTSVVTHRVTEVTTDENGSLAWKTKGDANNVADEALVPAKNLVGVYAKSFRGVGNVAMFMQSTKGLILCVVCPIILLLGYDIIRRRLFDRKKKDEEAALRQELEALRAEREHRNDPPQE